MKETFLLKEIYPKVEKSLTNKTTRVNMVDKYYKFVDKNNMILNRPGPSENIMFNDTEIESIFNLVGVTTKEINDIKKKSKDIKATGITMSYPLNSLLPLIIRYYLINEPKSNAYKDLNTYLMLSIYPIIFYKYFKFKPNENIMTYTINNLSQKFKVRQTNNLLEALADTAIGALNLHKDDLIKGTDKGIVDYVLSMRTRLNSFMKKIAQEFYKNQQEGKYINLEIDNNDKENYREADASSYAINGIVNKVSLKLLVDGPPIKLITISAKTNQVSVNELRNYISRMIVTKNRDEINIVMESILFLFMFDSKNTIQDINSDKFILYCLDLYKRANTTDKNIIRIKTILDKWLTEAGIYKKTQRNATINNFRKALFTFFVLTIQYFNTK
jgi:hypothetical protein